METNNQKNDQNIIPNDADKQQKGVNVPNLRFPEFNKEYIKSTLEFITKKIERKAINQSNIPVTMISYGNGFILQSSKYSKNNAGNSLQKYTLLKKGELAYNHGASKNKPYGICYELKEFDEALVPFVYHCFSIKNGVPKYWQYSLNTKHTDRQLKKLVSSGARMDGLLNISYLDYMSININIPSIQEQQKIGKFLNLIDQRIDTQNKIIEDLDTLKNSIMDQLLMRDIFDEISIKDFINQGYARIIKASEMKKFSGEKLYLSTSSIDKNGILKIECKITYNDRPSRASMIPIKHSIWFAKMKDSIKVYKSENDDESKYILSTGFYGILCNEDVVNSDWMVEIFKSNYFNNQKDRFSEGSSMSGIKENQLEDIKVKIFKNKNLEKEYCQ